MGGAEGGTHVGRLDNSQSLSEAHLWLNWGVEVAILEVGLGLDTPNVIARPVVCAITPLGMDHIELLGDTLPMRTGR